MNARIKDKIAELEKYLSELDPILPSDFEEYEQNLEKKAACERYFEKIIEAAVDLAFLVVKESGRPIPEEDKEAFDLLFKEKIISLATATRLKEAKGMRNLLAHEYGIVDDTIVFESITEEIRRDLKKFIDEIKNNL